MSFVRLLLSVTPHPRTFVRVGVRRRVARAEAFSIRRQEGSRWGLRRTRLLWRLEAALVPAREAELWGERQNISVATRIWMRKWLPGPIGKSECPSFVGPEDTNAPACE